MLKSLVEHHIALIRRFGDDEFEEFSLLFLKLDSGINIDVKKSIQIIFRESDLLFEYDEHFILLLPKTGWNGAVTLLNGLQKFLNQEFKDAIITFPDDGDNVEKLLTNFANMVNKTYHIDIRF
ncbi:MAG: hypothetical protein DSZ06_04240 [Sulfurospirillum sp.]|nr:MAG: hypothetical protein DSZ06_04240 [Sulfurospirillum sp.]